MSKQYLIQHEDVLRILKSLDEVPHKYVKHLVPYIESALHEVKDEPERFMEETKTKKDHSKEDSKKDYKMRTI